MTVLPIGTSNGSHRIVKVIHYWAEEKSQLRYEVECLACRGLSSRLAYEWLTATCAVCVLARHLESADASPDLKEKTVERFKEHVRCCTKYGVEIADYITYWREIREHPELAEWEPLPKTFADVFRWNSILSKVVHRGIPKD